VPATISAAQARRLLLGAQGLLDAPTTRATAGSVHQLVMRLGYVQIDSINVVERAHHLILATRLHGYRPSLLHGLLERRRQLFEHWTHDAAAIPTVWFPYWHHRFERARRELPRRTWWNRLLGSDPEAVIERIRARLEREGGPLLTRDFLEGSEGPEGSEAKQGAAATSWWGWSPQKAALEYLWATGEVAIAGRQGFNKIYDLTRRVLPEAAAMPRPSPEQHVDWACRTALERLGAATPEEIAAFWRAIPAGAVRGWCEAAVTRGEIAAVTIEAACARAAGGWPPWRPLSHAWHRWSAPAAGSCRADPRAHAPAPARGLAQRLKTRRGGAISHPSPS
jgi:uncharacterized protein YcaQ